MVESDCTGDAIYLTRCPIPPIPEHCRTRVKLVYGKGLGKGLRILKEERKSGDYAAVVPPVPIPNTEVKYGKADGSPSGRE